MYLQVELLLLRLPQELEAQPLQLLLQETQCVSTKTYLCCC